MLALFKNWILSTEEITEGYEAGEIASELGLSVNTVKNFRAGILNYFEAVTMVQAVAEAFKREVEDGRIN